MKKYLIGIGYLAMVACQIDREFTYQSARDLLVLNSFLEPDSLIAISLTKTGPAPLQESTFEVVSDGIIQLFENDSLVGLPAFDEHSQQYLLNYTPLPGKKYSLIAEVEGYSTLSASTSVPHLPDITGCFSLAADQRGCTSCQYSQVNLSFKNTKPNSRFWLTIYSLQFGRKEPFGRDSSIVERRYGGLYSKSTLPDPFNSANDEGNISYDPYIRIHTETNQPSDFLVDIFGLGYWSSYQFDDLQQLDPRLGLYTVVMHASPEFDQYMKDIVINERNDVDLIDGVPNPFAQRVSVFSNIENGVGIFAGYHPIVIPTHQQQCK